LKQVNDEWAKDKEEREKRLHGIQLLLVKDKVKAPPQWYVNGQGQTMVVIPGPVEFLMGSPTTEAGREGGKVETQHRKRIGRSFAIAAHEVTVAQFLRFRKNHIYNKQYARGPEYPVNEVAWYEAAEYCNWLSKQEGLPDAQWCYEPNTESKDIARMKPAADYLRRIGYRLPSEAEWEYACRAVALTSRYYGETEELLSKYAWYTKNSLDRWMLPVGSLQPNDLGLFDMLGNAQEWCQDQAFYYALGALGKPSEDQEQKRDTTDRPNRVLRGNSFTSAAVFVRSANRSWIDPGNRGYNIGFRAAKTLTTE
jgi:formylglycine-generating enzyme required for sulfatase activity